MCTDISALHFVPYPKHETPPQFRTKPAAEIDRLTQGRDSLFYPSVSSADLENEVLVGGEYVESSKPATVQKIMAFDYDIGASEGLPSRWALVEITNTDYHGRPISSHLYERKRRRTIPCCEEGAAE